MRFRRSHASVALRFASWALAAGMLAWSASARTSAATTSFNYVALGDSITYTGSAVPGGWVNLYSSDLNSDLHTNTAVTNFGIWGATSAQILDSVEHDSSVRRSIEDADLVTYQAGINDFLSTRWRYVTGACGGTDNEDCLRAMVANFDTNWDLLLSEIQALTPSATMRAMDIYYPVTVNDETMGYFGVLNSYLSQMNAHIWANPGGSAARVHVLYNGETGAGDPYIKGYILPDRVHPSELGHAVIAASFRILDYAGLNPSGPPPPSVGGIAEPPDLTALRSTAASSARSHGSYFVGAGVALVVEVAGAVGWRRRRG